MVNLMITVYTINELRGSAAIIFSDKLDFSKPVSFEEVVMLCRGDVKIVRDINNYLDNLFTLLKAPKANNGCVRYVNEVLLFISIYHTSE